MNGHTDPSHRLAQQQAAADAGVMALSRGAPFLVVAEPVDRHPEIERIVAQEESEATERTTDAQAAALIAELADTLRARWPDAAELIALAAGGIGLVESAAGSRGAERPSMARILGAKRARLVSDHARALDALRLSTAHQAGEAAWTLACHLREAASALAPVYIDDEAGERIALPDDDAERRALALARRDTRLAHLSDRQLLATLRRFALPRNAKIGAGSTRDGLSALEEADLVRDILGAESSNSATALVRAMQRAENQREERFAPELAACDTTCRERVRAAGAMLAACQPQPSNEKLSDTECVDTGSRRPRQQLGSRLAR